MVSLTCLRLVVVSLQESTLSRASSADHVTFRWNTTESVASYKQVVVVGSVADIAGATAAGGALADFFPSATSWVVDDLKARLHPGTDAPSTASALLPGGVQVRRAVVVHSPESCLVVVVIVVVVVASWCYFFCLFSLVPHCIAVRVCTRGCVALRSVVYTPVHAVCDIVVIVVAAVQVVFGALPTVVSRGNSPALNHAMSTVLKGNASSR